MNKVSTSIFTFFKRFLTASLLTFILFVIVQYQIFENTENTLIKELDKRPLIDRL
ncbi:MAG: hypothetical protein ACJA0N_001033, partial [Pseudohongiellaceae bacterium]